jgi:hypothetical protein
MVDLERATGRGQHPDGWMLKRSFVCASARDQMRHRISADDLVLDVEPQDGEGRAPARHDLGDERSDVRASAAEFVNSWPKKRSTAASSPQSHT